MDGSGDSLQEGSLPNGGEDPGYLRSQEVTSNKFSANQLTAELLQREDGARFGSRHGRLSCAKCIMAEEETPVKTTERARSACFPRVSRGDCPRQKSGKGPGQTHTVLKLCPTFILQRGASSEEGMGN